MQFWFKTKDREQVGLLTRLIRDRRANTMAIMAAALMPLAGLIGGALDLSRLYIVKTRLQHACDAGALAGRKAMGGGIWTQNSGTPGQTATRFFNANIAQTSFGAQTITHSFTESAGKVTGTASAVVPMTVMRVLGKEQETLTIVCDAEMRLPNTDVMFVLDVTGSMDFILPGDTQKKLVGLKTAVLCFYETLARENTSASCVGGDPSGGIGPETQVRFGFVPYDTNVNVGRLLNPDWFVDRAEYQSRQRVTVYGTITGYTDGNKADWSNWSSDVRTTTGTEAECRALTEPTIRAEARTATYGNGKNESSGGLAGNGTFQSDQGWRDREYEFRSWASGTNNCRYRTRTRNYTRTYTLQKVDDTTSGAIAFNAWLYDKVEFNVAPLKNGTTWNNSITLPINNNFGNLNINWAGCIEERSTIRATSYYPIDPNAIDLDIDRVPSTGDDATRWRPALPVTYQRKVDSSNGSARSLDRITTFTNNYSPGSYACTTPATKMKEWVSSSDFETYVNSLTPGSNTYHDIGLIWGARLMSPTGLFASENRFTPEGGEIERHMVFMTDGDACTGVANYQAYGLSWYDRRQTDPAVAPTDGCSTTGTLTEQVNARTQAICTSIKNKNITLWVIWFGTSNTTIEGQMTTCASPSRFFSARNSEQLQQTFRNIANQISQLRLTS